MNYTGVWESRSSMDKGEVIKGKEEAGVITE